MEELSKYQFLQEVQLWPINRVFNYSQWLENFDEGEDREIAKQILDTFIYIPDSHLDQMLLTIIGKCGYFFQNKVNGWSHDDFFKSCWYSFIPGETASYTDSGYIFTRKLRELVGIPDDHILSFDVLIQRLGKDSSIKNVILVDDFVGSGTQCDMAWNNHSLGASGLTLSSIAKINKLNILYAPLIVNKMGLERITDSCQGLELVYMHLLEDEYNLFNPNGMCWNGDMVLFRKWELLFNKICSQEKIPLTNGEVVTDGRGFGEQGLAIAFHHGIPDACPAFFYWESDTWKPLIKKHYQYGCKR